jgi:hypothetical protein
MKPRGHPIGFRRPLHNIPPHLDSCRLGNTSATLHKFSKPSKASTQRSNRCSASRDQPSQGNHATLHSSHARRPNHLTKRPTKFPSMPSRVLQPTGTPESILTRTLNSMSRASTMHVSTSHVRLLPDNRDSSTHPTMQTQNVSFVEPLEPLCFPQKFTLAPERQREREREFLHPHTCPCLGWWVQPARCTHACSMCGNQTLVLRVTTPSGHPHEPRAHAVCMHVPQGGDPQSDVHIE